MPQPYFRTHRNVDLSLTKYVRSIVEASWTNVTIVKAFLDSYKVKELPIISVECPDIQNITREVGSTALRNEYTVNIDIFGTSVGFTNDMGDFLVENLRNGIPYYEFSDGSGETMDQSANGRLRIAAWVRNEKFRGGESPHPFDRYRRTITFLVRK